MNSDYVFIAIGLALLVVVIVVSAYQNKRRKEMLAQQAEKRGGEFSDGGFWSRSELRLPYKGNTILIYSIPGGKNRPPYTYAEMKSSAPTLPTLDVLRNNLSQKIMGAFGKERILLDDEEFDRQCVVRGEDELAARRILTASVRNRFTDGSLRTLEVKMNPKEIKFIMQSIPSNEEEYDNFIDAVFLVIKNLHIP